MINRKQTYALTLTLLFLASQTCSAQNRVVVIPMAGDDIPAEMIPSTPVAAANTSESDYRLALAPSVLQDFAAAIDNTTGLMWQRRGSPTELNWEDAVSYCQDLQISTTSDWRLPTILELQSIVDYGSSSPAIAEPTFQLTATRYWSSTTRSTNANSAWFVNFSPFGSMGTQSKAVTSNVRCVR